MQQCVIGVFESSRESSIAKENLRTAGFPDSDISEKSGASRPSGAEHESGISGFFRSLFGTEGHPHIDNYSEAVERGHSVLIVDAGNSENADKAKFIMERACAFDVEARTDTTAIASNAACDTNIVASEQAPAKVVTASAIPLKSRMLDTEETVSRRTDSPDGTEKIPVVEEELTVGKREVVRDRVRIYTRVVEEPVEKTVTLREQRILVERRPVERQATDADWAKSQEREFELRTIAEVPVVQKSARVVEEVEIGRETTEHTETVRDTVRHTDVEVENMDVPQTKPQRTRKPAGTEKRQIP